MKIYNLPKKPSVLLFDIDSTLYRNQEYYDLQETLLVKRLSSELNKDVDLLQKEINKYRNEFSENNNGKNISLGNTFKAFGCSISQNAQWRSELFEPEEYLQKDNRLLIILKELSKKYKITALTNNHTEIGIRTLKTLGVYEVFETIVGLDKTLASKPHQAVYDYFLSDIKELPKNIISIGDRFSVDIEKPVEMGMGGILVENMEDVYSLSRII